MSRATAKRIGIVVLCVAPWLGATTACIFDKDNYQGGGRAGQGAGQNTTATATGSTTASATSDQDSGAPPSDAAGLLD